MVVYCFSSSEDPVISSHFCKYPFWTRMTEFGVELLNEEASYRVFWVQDNGMYNSIT